MATAVQKITLASARDIPFNKLVLSQANVRRVKAGVSLDDLAASIARRGLIQSLHVRAVLDANGGETGMFEVPAGGRRYRALELLVKAKRLAKTAPVPCVVSDASSGILVEEISLAENDERAPLHPLDQYRAFQAMREKGMTEEAIAAAFFVGVNVVKQRLRLASVSATLLDIYAEDGITLDMLMAFTVSEDHARQEQVWAAISGSWQKEPWQIRRMLTESTVRASDKRALFVGVDAYEEAGGVVLRDLFQSDDGGWLQDAALLDRLAAEKLRMLADEIAGEGWKWIEAAVSLPYGVASGMRALAGTPLDLTAEEDATIAALTEENDRLVAGYEDADELPDAVDERLGEIEAALSAFDERPVRYDPAEIARAGVFVSIGNDGRLLVDRGYVRSEDEAPVTAEPAGDPAAASDVDRGDGDAVPTAPAIQRAVITIGGAAAEPEPEEEDDIRPLPDRLLAELTAHRTLALRDAVAARHATAWVHVRWPMQPGGGHPHADDPRPTLLLATRSDLDLAAQVTAPGATWLDHRLVERERMPLSTGGFGGEARDAMQARAEHLASQGLARRDGQRILLQRDLIATLRQRELDAVGERLSADTGLRHVKAAAGDNVSGTYRRQLALSSGRFAMVDDGLGFQLVPWAKELDRKLGQHVAGVAKDGGGIEWGLGRKRDLGLGL